MSMTRVGMIRSKRFLRLVAASILMLACAGPLSGISADPGACIQLRGQKIRWIVPNAAGGGYDTYSRLIEPYLEKALGAEVAVENIPGAGGMVGAKSIKDAQANGLTIGILDGSGMLIAALSGEPNAPDLGADFTILKRIARSRQVWATSADSPLGTISGVLAAAEKRPIVFGTLNVASLSFYNIAVSSHILGLDPEIVTGYRGSRAGVLAVQRGEIDIICYSFESILRHIESGAIRPLLQVSEEPIAAHPSLQDIPLLGGANGLAARRAVALGRDGQRVQSDVGTLAAIIGVGRLIVAPKGLTPSVAGCLERALDEALSDPGLMDAAKKAKRSFDIGSSRAVETDLDRVSRNVHRFGPLLQNAIHKVRN